MNKNTLWILVANNSEAQIYESQGKGRKISLISEFEHSEGRAKTSELLTDSPGCNIGSACPDEHSVGENQTVHHTEQKRFARQLVQYITKAKENLQFDQLALVAPPQFLGVLRQIMKNALRSHVLKEVHKDLPMYLSQKEKVSHLREYLDLWNG
jgi:protein required for attachment to host cells